MYDSPFFLVRAGSALYVFSQNRITWKMGATGLTPTVRLGEGPPLCVEIIFEGVSDKSHDKLSKKDLLLGKGKDKMDKKDRGYATPKGESSPQEDTEMRSPSKVKKLKPFEFSSKTEKQEKSRDEEVKDKGSDKEKKEVEEEKEENKDKKKDTKSTEDVIDISEDLPLFGVSLSVAVERKKCHDGVDIPLTVGNYIDHVQEIEPIVPLGSFIVGPSLELIPSPTDEELATPSHTGNETPTSDKQAQVVKGSASVRRVLSRNWSHVSMRHTQTAYKN